MSGRSSAPPYATAITGTLYRHFPTRTALAEAVYREELTALCDRGCTLQATLPAAEAPAPF